MFSLGKEAALAASLATRQRLSALKRIIPLAQVTAALRRAGSDRRVCLRTGDAFMVWFVIALGLFCNDCYRQVYRWLTPWKKGGVPGRSTLCEARQRLGVGVLVRLAAAVVRLLGAPAMAGAYYAGLRLMAVDGFTVDVPDTPLLERVFGRPKNGRAPGAFPQAQVLGLVEVGTHVFWRWLIKGCHVDENALLPPLLKHLTAGMLLLWDRGFASFQGVRQVTGRGAHLLARWKKNRILPVVRRLADGSYRSCIYENDRDRKAGRHGILVRIIEYTLTDPSRPGHQEKHLLLTTLLDEKTHPARVLVALYHARWEEELAIDELKTHTMERPVLRSQTPGGVVQELYGLLLAHYVIRTLMCQAALSTGASITGDDITGVRLHNST
jgi:hypothetical protein